MKETLYIVSTPIGNYKDITLRALEVLQFVDFIICEEFKEAHKLLSHFNINKDLVSLNEHNEKSNATEYLKMIKDGKSAALISDCGTPVFSDPGLELLNLCIQCNINVIPIPGVNSLITALTASGFNLDNFYYAGWLSPKSELRKRQLFELSKRKELIILMETPYRLQKLVSEVASIFNGNSPAVIAYELTTPNEQYFRGKISYLAKLAAEKKLKGEFVLLLDNRKKN